MFRLAACLCLVVGGLEPARAEAGQFTQAVETARQAMALAADGNKPAMAAELKKNISLYENNIPLRSSQ